MIETFSKRHCNCCGGAYYDEESECLVFLLEDPVLWFVAIWLDDYWSDCCSGFVWWPLAAIG